LNEPPEEFILVREDRVLAFVGQCFRKSGIDTDHAATIARLLVNSDLRGVRSHGSRCANGYTRGFEQGSYNPNPSIEVVRDTPAMTVLDGDGTLGYLPMVRATEMAVEKARATGVGIGLVRHIGHYGSAGHYARICLEAGCVGFSVAGFRAEGTSSATNPKRSVGFGGNPPISFAIPAGDEPDVVLDAGASILATYDGAGSDELLENLPSAFFKSMGLVAAANLLGGALAGFTGPAGDAIEAHWPGADRGGMVLAIDLEQAVDGDLFRAETDRYSRDVRKNYAPIPGTDTAWLPGATEEQCLARSRAEGIRFEGSEQNAARAMHEHFAVPLPWD
jgi:LDH2 family malate/lactate/ureidoglycolate dehydrogenase